MRVMSIVALLFCFWPAASAPLYAGESKVATKMAKIARNLAAEYRSNRPAVSQTRLAVFPLNSSKALKKRRVGFAVSESLLPHLVKVPPFVVIERTELNKILAEQRLQLTGAIDSNTAVKIGKLLGAQVLLLGSVEKLGGKYQVTARLVDSESGEVHAVAYEELDANTFEDEAKSYFVVVPDRQMIGLYFLFNYRPPADGYPAAVYSRGFPTPTSTTIEPRTFPLSLIGGGLRYSPLERWMLDASLAANPNTIAAAKTSETTGSSSGTQLRTFRLTMARLSLNFRCPLREVLDAYFGVGAAGYMALSNSLEFKDPLMPHLRCGLEYRPRGQRRIGLGLFVNYDLLKKTGKSLLTTGTVFSSSGDLSESEETPLFKLRRFSIEPTVALYF